MPTYRFCKASVAFAIVISVLLPGGAAHATPDTLFITTVACPPFWPSADAPGISHEKYFLGVYDGPYVQLRGEDDYYGLDGNLMLDCHYKGDRRLTISVQEASVDCAYKPLPGMPKIKDIVCTATADHTLAVTTQIAEHVTLQTTFAGFGLRQSLDAITALAAQRSLHFEVIYDSDKIPLRVIITGKSGELTTLTLSRRTGLSREVLLSWPWDTNTSLVSLYHATALRFGFRRSGSWIFNYSWTSADKQAILTLVRRSPTEQKIRFYDVRLTDLHTLE